MMSNRIIKAGLLATTVIAGMAFAGPAYAQAVDAPGAAQPQNPTQPAEAEDASTAPATQAPAPGEPTAGTVADTEGDDTIVVTGTILRATSRATPSPVTVLDMDESEKRGNNTVNDAIQTLSANGAGTLPNSFTANGAFAAGAAAASLRGLLTSNTLVLFDGLRAAYYPLADDGTRNFVDLNTIPDAIVDRVEVLKDGASSTYGADAVAGVINIITKRQITGLHLQAEAGIAQRGHGRELRGDATYGFGDLDDDGFNVYATGMYYEQKPIEQSDLRAPFNSANLCNVGEGGTNSGFYFGECGTFNLNAQRTFFVRPSGPLDNIAASNAANPNRSDFQLLNPAAGCHGQPTYTLTPDDAALVPSYPAQVCTDDWVANYFNVTAGLRRYGTSVRGTLAVSDNIEAYAMGNYVHSRAWYDSIPARFRRATPPGASGLTTTTNNISLPVYVCPAGQGATNAAGNTVYTGCTNPDGTPVAGAVLNPNNPFAASGQYARVTGFVQGVNEEDDIRTGAWRLAGGIRGTFLNDFRFNVEATTMRVKNTWIQNGIPYYSNLLDAVATGAYNFVNPEMNSQATLDFVFPENRNVSRSRLSQIQASVSKDLLELAGGPLQIGIGAQMRWESVNAPSANPDRDASGNPLGPDDFEGLTIAQIDAIVDQDQRFSSGINPFGTVGKRNVKSAYAEMSAPIIDELDINLSGRFDKYSSGQKAFSPKAGVKFTPVREIAFRSTWSKAFRIGSFAESFALPTTGYISGAGTVPQSYANLFTGANAGYISSYNLGLTQVGNQDLDPERSRNFTVGVVAEPIRNVSFSIDFWDIKKKDVITGADFSPAVAAYYAGQPIPAGFIIIPDTVLATDFGAPAGTPNRIGFVQYSYENAAQQRAQGIDFSASAKRQLGSDVTFSTNLEGSYLRRLATCYTGTGCQEYAGTIGPYVITSAAGSPRWRGSWQNTVEFGRAYASLTAWYTSGYKTTAEDISGAGTSDDCHLSSQSAHDNAGNVVQCRVKRTLYWNLGTGMDVNDRINVYLNVNNLFDQKPPLDYATYGAFLYNPAWSHPMAIGRFFRAGVKVNF